MARRRKEEPVYWKVAIPSWLAWEIETVCYNPVRGKPDYGTRSQLITDLLIQHIRQIKEKQQQEPQP